MWRLRTRRVKHAKHKRKNECHASDQAQSWRKWAYVFNTQDENRPIMVPRGRVAHRWKDNNVFLWGQVHFLDVALMKKVLACDVLSWSWTKWRSPVNGAAAWKANRTCEALLKRCGCEECGPDAGSMGCIIKKKKSCRQSNTQKRAHGKMRTFQEWWRAQLRLVGKLSACWLQINTENNVFTCDLARYDKEAKSKKTNWTPPLLTNSSNHTGVRIRHKILY